jgi:ribosomal protein S18 acetylase RimI-like enzyme
VSVLSQGVRIRPAKPSDLDFLGEMLLEAAYRPDARRPRADERLADPGIARYLTEWGRPGDAAVIAVGKEGRRLGAAWCRLFSEEEPGFGFVDSETPEISIAVGPDFRGQGIGAALLAALVERASREGVRALSLSVSPENPAVRLYEHAGFIRIDSRDENWTMRLDLSSAR